MRTRAPSGKDPAENRTGETVEEVGGLTLAQPRRGYRYGLDPFLLAAFIRPRLREKVVDLGTGCGIIALLLSRRWPTLKVWGIELQPELAGMAQENARRNGLGDRCSIIEGDGRQASELLPAGKFQRVVSNPPFRPPGAGRICPEPQRALARQELAFTLADLALSASVLLGHGGILDCIHLPERLPEIFRTLTDRNLEPKRIRFVHPFSSSSPEMVLVSARKGGRPGLEVESPLVVFSSPGIYSSEAGSAIEEGR
jgi:tRNA1Val (adenine37-N6)-methyltransferase